MALSPTAPATSPRTTLRRRRLFFVLILAALALFVWFRSSRGDSRFVGTWRIAGFDRSADATLTLNADGMGHWPRTLSGELEHFPWVIRDGRFVLGWAARPADWWIVRNLISTITARQDYPGTMDLEIVEVTPQHIILRESANKLDITLTRVTN